MSNTMTRTNFYDSIYYNYNESQNLQGPNFHNSIMQHAASNLFCCLYR
jgi:hypothetical protein